MLRALVAQTYVILAVLALEHKREGSRVFQAAEIKDIGLKHVALQATILLFFCCMLVSSKAVHPGTGRAKQF